MAQNTIITQCKIHKQSNNLIIAQNLLYEQTAHYSLVCPKCHCQKIANEVNLNSKNKLKQQRGKGVYLCEQSRQYFLQWTDGLANTLAHLQYSQNFTNTSHKYSKLKSIFSIPQFLLNKSPDNIIKIFNAVLTEQIKLFQGNIQYISSQKYQNLNSQIFITDLFHIVLSSHEYSLNILLQRFKKLIKQYYLSLGVKISDQYINRIQLSSKLTQRLKQFKQNLLRKYSNIIIFKIERYSQPNSQRSKKSMNIQKNDEVISVESEQYRQSLDKMQESDVVEKKIVVGSQRQSENSAERISQKKINEQNSQNNNIKKIKFTSIQQQIGNTSSNKTTSKQNLQNSKLASSTQKKQEELPKQISAEQQKKLLQSFKTPKNQRAFTQNKQFFNSLRAAHCRTQKSPQKQQKATQIKQSTITKVHTVKSDQLYPINQLPISKKINANMAISQIIQVPSVIKTNNTQQNKNNIILSINSVYMNQIINKLAIQNNNLKNLKQDIVKDVNSMDKAINIINEVVSYNNNNNQINNNTYMINNSKNNSKDNSKNNYQTKTNSNQNLNLQKVIPKQKYDILQKQYMITLHQLQQSKHKFTTKSHQCELLKKQVQLQFTNIRKTKQVNQKLQQDKRRLYHSQVTEKLKQNQQQIHQYIQRRQIQQEQQNMRNLAIFNKQLIEKIQYLETELNKYKNQPKHICKQHQTMSQLTLVNKKYTQIIQQLNNKNKTIKQMQSQLQLYYTNVQSQLNKSLQLQNTIQQMQKTDKILRQQISKINYDLQQMLLYKVQNQFNIQKYKYELQGKNKYIQQITSQLQQMYLQNKHIVQKYNKLVQMVKVKQNNNYKINQLFNQLRQNENMVANLKNRIKTMQVQLQQQNSYEQNSINGQKTTRTHPKFHIQYKQSQSQSDPQNIDLSHNEYEDIIRQLKREIGEKVIQIQSYNVKLEQLQESGREAQEELQKLNRINQNLSNCIQQLTQKYQNQIENYDEQIRRKNIKNKENEQKIVGLMEQLKKFNEENKQMRKQIERVHDQMIKNLNKQIEQHKNAKDKLQIQKVQIQTKHKQQIKNIEDQLINLRAQNQQMNIKQLQDQRQQSNQVKYLQEQLVSKQVKIQSLNEQLKQLQDKINKQIILQPQNAKQPKNIQNQLKEFKINQLHIQIDKLNEKLVNLQLKQKQNDKLSEKIKILSEQNQKLHQIIDSVEVSSQVDKYQPKAELTSENKFEFEKKIENLQNTVTNLQQRIKNQCSFDEQMMQQLILTESRLKSKQFQIEKVVNVCYQMLEDIQQAKKEKYRQMMKSWKYQKKEMKQ